MAFISLNGIIKSAEALLFYELERFRFADAIFESILYLNGNFPLLSYHQERLNKACALMGFQSFVVSENHLLQVVKENNGLDKILRVRLSLVRAEGENYLPLGNATNVLIEVKIVDSVFKETEQLGIFESLLKHPDFLSSIKSSNALIYVMAKRYAQEQNISDVLLLNTKKQIIEATASNVFIVKDNELFTPSSVSACVNGVARKFILDNFEVKEIEMKASFVEDADEIFLTNGIQLIQSVRRFQGRKLKQNIALNLIEELKEKLKI